MLKKKMTRLVWKINKNRQNIERKIIKAIMRIKMRKKK